MTDSEFLNAVRDALEFLTPLLDRLSSEVINAVYGGKKVPQEVINSLDLAINLVEGLKTTTETEAQRLGISLPEANEGYEATSVFDVVGLIETARLSTMNLSSAVINYHEDPEGTLKIVHYIVSDILNQLRAIREVIAVL